MSALILADPLETALLQVAKAEGLVASDGPFWVQRFANNMPTIDESVRAHLFANLFLHPEIKLGVRYEIAVPVQTDLLCFDQGGNIEYAQRFDDMSLLIGYCRAVDPSLTMERIADVTHAYCETRGEVQRPFGSMPAVNGEGRPILLADAIQLALTKVQPQYSEEQLAAYGRYSAASADAGTILKCIADVENVWQLRTDDNPVSFHPRLARDYRNILDQDLGGDEEISDTDLFFLTIRALRTLPVGRTLRETLELGSTKEGAALRARITELYGEMQAGATDLAALIRRIDNDADQYRSLTARLQSSHFLSNYVDVVLSGLGLIPLVGTYASALGLAKSSWATRSTHKTRAELNKLSWAEYQGRAI